MTRERLRDEMSLDEFIDQLAYHLYFDPLPNTWQQASMIATQSLLPHLKKGKKLKPFAFVPVRELAELNDTTERDNLVAAAVVARLKARQQVLSRQPQSDTVSRPNPTA